MSTQPHISDPSPDGAPDGTAGPGVAGSGAGGSGVTGLPPLATPATLEALLSLRSPASGSAEPASATTTTGTQAGSEIAVPLATPSSAAHPLPLALPEATAIGLPPFADGQTQLLFVHAGSQESVLAQAWLQRMLASTQLHTARFQDGPAEQALQLMPHVVLVDFDPTSIDMAAQLVAQMRIASPHLPLIAVGRTKHPQCMLAALRAGVQDFLDVDGSLLAAQQTLQDLLRRSPPVQSTGTRAPLTAILSARAGLGSSLLASHLAWYLQQHLHTVEQAKAGDNRTELDGLLIDLGHPNGDCPMYLNTQGEFDFLEAVNNLRRFDRRLASSGLARHASGLRLLSLPRQSGLLRDVSYANADALLQRLRQYFRHVVADLGAVSQTQLAMRVVRRASHIWVLCDQSVASVVSTTELLQQLGELQIERERLQLIVCRHDSRLELDAQQIAHQLGLPLLAVIPERRRELAQAVNQGQLLSPQQRREPYVQAVEKLATHLLAAHHPEAIPHGTRPAGARPASLLASLIQRLRRS